MSPQGMTVKANTRIEFLDLCRIVAFLSVLIGHKFHGDVARLSEPSGTHSIIQYFFQFITPFIHGGGFGVVIFFCVSGYIIRAVLEKESTAEFFIKRFFRIYPLYVAALIIQVFLTPTEAIPSLSTIILQASLLGDFFNTPYSMNGVEWTLRIEIIFYLFMGTLRSLGMLKRNDIGLSIICLAATVLLFVLPPFPGQLFRGYFSIYFPFLFIGLVVYEYENDSITFSTFVIFVASTLVMYCNAIESICPNWAPHPFAAIAVGTFFALWLARDRIALPNWARLFSHLTFPVYLFHNWIYDILLHVMPASPFPRLFGVALLFLICYLAYIVIEKPSIKLGRYVCRCILSTHSSAEKP